MLCPTALRRHAWLQLPAARLHGSPAAADAQPPPPPADAGGAAAAQAAQRRRSAGGGVPAAADVPQPVSTKVVLYRGRGMPLLRALVRLKVFQLAGVAALAIPINSVWATGGMAGTQALLASALVGGAGFAASTLWYGSRRYVGELALLPGQPGQPPRVRLSVLDFWGNREVCVGRVARVWWDPPCLRRRCTSLHATHARRTTTWHCRRLCRLCSI